MQLRPSLLIALGLLSGLTPFAIDMYLPSIPAIARDLVSSIELAQLSVTVYLAVFAAAQLVLGPLSDVHGRRANIGLGLAVFLLADIGCILAPKLHNGTAMPMILGMAVCGLLAGLSYRLMCCIDAPNHGQIRNPL